jgi:hypothetical protein
MQSSEERLRTIDVLKALVERVRVLYGVTKLVNSTSDSLVSIYIIAVSGSEPAGLHSITAHAASLLNKPYHLEWDAIQVPPTEWEPVEWLAREINGHLSMSGHLRGVNL